MSIACTWANKADATKNGWFSRRHRSRYEHDKAMDKYKKEREDKKAAQRARDARDIERGQRLRAERLKAATPNPTTKPPQERKRRGWKDIKEQFSAAQS